MAFLRGLDIGEFSFGFTRVSSTPSTEEKDLDMPIRPCAFAYVKRGKQPFYLLEQKSEGFYMRLNEKRVIDWLFKNGLASQLPPREGMRPGGLVLEQ